MPYLSSVVGEAGRRMDAPCAMRVFDKAEVVLPNQIGVGFFYVQIFGREARESEMETHL